MRRGIFRTRRIVVVVILLMTIIVGLQFLGRERDAEGKVREKAESASGNVVGESEHEAVKTDEIGTVEVTLRTPEETKVLTQRYRDALVVMGLPMPTGGIKPRIPLAKEPLQEPPGREHQIIVKFRDALLARADSEGRLVISSDSPTSELQRVIKDYGLTFSGNRTVTEADMTRLEARAMFNTQTEPADLAGMLTAHPQNGDASNVWQVAQALQNLEAVEFVTLASLDKPPPPPLAYDIAPASESFVEDQTYAGADGINLLEAWNIYGARGQGVRVTDCEYRFNAYHEDLRGIVTAQPWVDSFYSEYSDDHGTAVLGILVAAENLYGITGMVPEADPWFYADYATVAGHQQVRHETVAAAIAASEAGDVVLLEMQTTGAMGGFAPAEYSQAVWVAVKTGTDAGVHVIAAAGNGAQNLDAPEYAAYRNRGDSGSIIVGAGNASRERMGFSTYGARVNVQALGDHVVTTLGYGELRKYGDDHNQEYSDKFSGTSSASPIVTAAAVAIESIARKALNRSLTPLEMRELLIETGKAQGGDTSKSIGPLPDVMAALNDLLTGYPKLETLTPTAGSAGTQVTLTGTGFTGATAVKFNGGSASYSVINDTTIQATVPNDVLTGRITIETSNGTAVSRVNFEAIAGEANSIATAAPATLTSFTSKKGTPSTAQSFVVGGHNLDGIVTVTAPAGFEISTDGTNFSSSKILSPTAPFDGSTNYNATNWVTGTNAGIGFGPWAIGAEYGTNHYAGNFIGNPQDANISGLGGKAFGLYANPANSLAAVNADRGLSGPMKIGDTLTFQWAINNDSLGTGSKGFILYTGGAGNTELLRVDQASSPDAIVFMGSSSHSEDTGISYGVYPMTWKFTRTETNVLTVSSTGRDGTTNIVFTTNIAIAGSPDALRWYATHLDYSSESAEENDSRQPYFDNITIDPSFENGGALANTTLYTRLAANASVGNVSGNIAISSLGTTLAEVAASGTVESLAPDYDTWATDYGMNPAAEGAADKDPDGDGLLNLTEYFFGTDPTRATGHCVTLDKSETGVLKLHYIALETRATYEIQTRTNLTTGAWGASGITPTASLDQTGVPQGYLRMEAELPPATQAYYRVQAQMP